MLGWTGPPWSCVAAHSDRSVGLRADLPTCRALPAKMAGNHRRRPRQTAPPGLVGASVVKDDVPTEADEWAPVQPVALTALFGMVAVDEHEVELATPAGRYLVRHGDVPMHGRSMLAQP